MKSWQDSASLILAARQYVQKYNPASCNYKLLWLKRHQKSSFMPGMYVFPGGTTDAADSSLKWREIFAAFGVNNDSFASLVPKIAERPEIYRSRQDELPKEISLRITAIRETFEESGILMCRHKDADTSTNWVKHVSIPKNELQMWQSKVHNNATEFLTLCKKLECYPDLWALHEWRNWLTPTTMPVKRFNTIFYLACMPLIPYAEYEAVEMEDLKWEMPEDLFSLNITLPPTQQYEIARLSKFKSIDKLLDFAMERNTEEVLQLYLPVLTILKDGIVYVFPGDTMYPKDVNLLDEQQIDKPDITRYEYREMTPIKNRMEYWVTHIKVIFTDIHGKDNYVEISMPGYRKDSHGDTKNKL
ncbi:Acyl-coenzyme A diphosphatase NUDT19 [Formica fusca]